MKTFARTESVISPSPAAATGLSISALNRKRATTVEAMENDPKRIETRAAMRVRLSKPGKDRKVTDADKTIAAFPLLN